MSDPVVERIGPPLYSLLRFACPMRSSPFLGTERGWRATERQRSGVDGRVDDPNARFTRLHSASHRPRHLSLLVRP